MARSLPAYSVGTVAVALVGSTWTVAGTGTNFISPDGVPNYTLVGGDMFVIPGAGFGTVAAIASATSLTLDNWTGSAVSAGAAYKIYRFEGLPPSAAVALMNQLLALGTDASPLTSQTVDTGAVRFKFDDDGAGRMRIRVRASGAPGGDAVYVVGLLIDDATGVATFSNLRTHVSDAAYAALATDRLIAFTALTAPRIVSLPPASAYPAGQPLVVVDESGACSATNTIAAARAGSDTIDGATTATLNWAYGSLALVSNGSNAWTLISPAPPVASGVATVNFGAFPGASDAQATVADPGVLAGSTVIAAIQPAATADHSADEHWVEEIAVRAGAIVAGTGFTIFARAGGAPLYGAWNVSWIRR